MPKAGGVYADTAKNRALNRVGKPYGDPGDSKPGTSSGTKGTPGSKKGGGNDTETATGPSPKGQRPGDTKRRKGELLSVEEVDRRLVALGVDAEKLKAKDYAGYTVGKCVRSAIQKGYIEVKGEDKEELNQVVFKGTFDNCGHEIDVKLSDVLYQPDYAGLDYEGGQEYATVICKEMEDGKECEEGRSYLTRICTGKPDMDDGKFHNHCGACPGFGVCINDYREAHCDECGRHYWAGLMGGSCDRCHPDRREREDRELEEWM